LAVLAANGADVSAYVGGRTQMMGASPLRYPGGKSALSGLLREIRRLNRFGDRTLIEPFGGGAGASLSLLFREEAPEILINDADPAIFSFWWAALNRSRAFCELICKTPVSVAEWKRQREIYRSTHKMARLKKGFAAFYLNRCNRSGIIGNGSVIGGLRQEGTWKVGARFNRSTLIERCERLHEYRNRIRVLGNDGTELIRTHDRHDAFLFIDPPYYIKGRTLYLNRIDHDYHVGLSRQLRKLRKAAWIATYDDCSEIRQMYEGWAEIRPFKLRYTAAERASGREVLIAPRGTLLPTWQGSASITW
jgi:DNA adenine methylase